MHEPELEKESQEPEIACSVNGLRNGIARGSRAYESRFWDDAEATAECEMGGTTGEKRIQN